MPTKKKKFRELKEALTTALKFERGERVNLRNTKTPSGRHGKSRATAHLEPHG